MASTPPQDVQVPYLRNPRDETSGSAPNSRTDAASHRTVGELDTFMHAFGFAAIEDFPDSLAVPPARPRRSARLT
jgi:hypothetical protein